MERAAPTSWSWPGAIGFASSTDGSSPGTGNKLVVVEVRPGREAASRLLVPLLFAALLIAGVAALFVTRELRRGDDVVNSVKVTNAFSPADENARAARIRFELTEGDGRVALDVIDSDEEVTRAILAGGPLGAGRHRFEWDGRTDAGTVAPVGRYRVRIVLGDQDREVVAPDRIRVEAPGGA